MVVFMLYKFRFGVVVRLGIEQLVCFFRNTMQIYEMILNYQGILLFFYIILKKYLEYGDMYLSLHLSFLCSWTQECAEGVPKIPDVFPRFSNSFPRVFRWGYKRLKSCFCAFFLCNFAVPRSHFRSKKLCYTKVLSQ
jgi:hypothetical protein